MDIYMRASAFYQKAITEKRIYGKSLFGRELFAVKIGSGRPLGIATYGLHAREYITAELAFSQYLKGVKRGSLWLLPLTNPDGALLSEIGLDSGVGSGFERFLSTFSDEELRLWKANGRGVDLNVNFDADWGTGKRNVNVAGGENYIGAFPFSEPETLALKRFTLSLSPDYTLSFHTKGEELYWRYFQSGAFLSHDRRLASELSKLTGYPVKEAAGSVGGYKDWCIKCLKIPAFTLEVGNDGLEHPLKETDILEEKTRLTEAIYLFSECVGEETGY